MTSASVAQFMAILSGGVNPALLRQNGSTQTGSGQAALDFQSLIGANGQTQQGLTVSQLLAGNIQNATSDTTLTVQANGNGQTSPQPVVAGTQQLRASLQGITSSANGVSPLEAIKSLLSAATNVAEAGEVTIDGESGPVELSASLQAFIEAVGSGEEIDPSIIANLSESDLETLDALTAEDLPTVAIWQLIRQQASVDGENAIVLNLSEKGVPEDVIADLDAIFGTDDLITILRNPGLRSQFESALEDVDMNTIDAPTLAGVIDSVIAEANNHEGDIEDIAGNTIIFKVDPDVTIDELIEDLINDGYIEDPADVAVTFLPVDDGSKQQPVALTFVQQQLADGSEIPSQTATQVGSSANPFALKSGNIMDGDGDAADTQSGTTTGTTGAEQAARTTSGSNGDLPQSIADRLANITNSGQNASAQASDFAGLTVSADGDALVDADGNYVVPFEAGFKTATQAANPLVAQQNASQSHPATQTVAASLTKMASKAADGEDSQTYRLKLDPPELGRIDIEMDVIEKTGHLKAVITAEKPESLGLLQRDMHTLLKAMQDAGFEGMTQQDLTFNLSQNGSDMAGNGSDKGNGQSGANDNMASNQAETDVLAIEGEMTLIVDPATGQRHVNMMV